MKFKYIIMQELEGSNIANPYRIVPTEERAEQLCTELEKKYTDFIFWIYICEEDE